MAGGGEQAIKAGVWPERGKGQTVKMSFFELWKKPSYNLTLSDAFHILSSGS
jgi:hypothetical protein